MTKTTNESTRMIRNLNSVSCHAHAVKSKDIGRLKAQPQRTETGTTSAYLRFKDCLRSYEKGDLRGRADGNGQGDVDLTLRCQENTPFALRNEQEIGRLGP